MESFGGDPEHRLLALRMRCWWASPGPSFVAGGSGRLDALVLRGAGISSDRRKPPSLNCSETRRRDHARLGRRSDAQRQARLAKPGTRRNRFFASADGMQRYRCVPDPTWPQLTRLRHARGHAVVEDTASLTEGNLLLRNTDALSAP